MLALALFLSKGFPLETVQLTLRELSLSILILV